MQCNKCGSEEFRVIRTKNKDGYKERVKLCANCLTLYITEEKIKYALHPSKHEPEHKESADDRL